MTQNHLFPITNQSFLTESWPQSPLKSATVLASHSVSSAYGQNRRSYGSLCTRIWPHSTCTTPAPQFILHFCTADWNASMLSSSSWLSYRWINKVLHIDRLAHCGVHVLFCILYQIVAECCLVDQDCWVFGCSGEGFDWNRVSGVTYLDACFVCDYDSVRLWAVDHGDGQKLNYANLFEVRIEGVHDLLLLLLSLFDQFSLQDAELKSLKQKNTYSPMSICSY